MEVNKSKILEEKLREAACYGDEEAVKALLERNVRINTQHDINGWTPLHWAAKRGNVNVVRYLLSKGADPSLTSAKGETPGAIAENEEIRRLLGETGPSDTGTSSLPITPHFVNHHPSDYKVDLSELQRPAWASEGEPPLRGGSSVVNGPDGPASKKTEETDLVLKVRIAYLDDPDFVEIELSRQELTFAGLLRTCCEELGADVKRVLKIRKLPNTIVRKDKDVQRLSHYQELELVLDNVRSKPADLGAVAPVQYLGLQFAGAKHCPPGYLPFAPPYCGTADGTAVPGRAAFAKSSYCINGTILY